MSSRQQIKGRIASVKNTRQITKAMELVAASRMRKAQEAVGKTRSFSLMARELLTRLRQLVRVDEYELFAARPIKSKLIIAIASDRGLAGAYNSNVIKALLKELDDNKKAGIKSYVICVGRQVANFAARLKDTEVVGDYIGFPDEPTTNDLQPIIGTAIKMFVGKEIDAANIIYTEYISSVTQEVRKINLLPAGFDEAKVDQALQDATFEPSAEVVLRSATLRLLETQLLQALLESVASEHSTRMLAMKNATDNATELADDLTLAYNNARQAAITQELAEISGGAEALNG